MKILIVDDEKALCFALEELFKKADFETSSVNSFDECLEILKKDIFEIIILDYQLKGKNGLELLNIIKKEYPLIQIIFITAFGSENLAITAIKNGAYDYVKKPFDNEELINRVNHIRESINAKSKELDNKFGYYFSASMTTIIEKIKTIAKTDVPVLITGESGTGKELIAKLIHFYSERKGNFVGINCSAIPENLIESELFGAEKGSYTGANEKKAGFFELTNNGTIFLDEIGEMKNELQVKLLRVLQENEIIRIGGGIPIKINSRVVSATNRIIDDEIKNKNFREDLFYRLNVIQIDIPPLRTRREEIIPLAEMFLNEFCKKYNKKIIGIEKETQKELYNQNWTGNIRQLKNVIEKAVIFCKSDWIGKNDIIFDKDENHFTNEIDKYNFERLPNNLTQAKKIISKDFEEKFINYYLMKNNNNIKKTGDEIGLHRQDLYKKIREFNKEIP
jgi:DNA-binding NtrC family response regulator